MMNRGEVHRLLLLIKTLRDAISTAGKATVEAIRENTEAAQEGAKHEPSEPLSRISLDVHIPREETDRYYAQQQQSRGLQWWTFWATVATFVAVAIYAFITYLQWHTMIATYCEIRKQTTSAEVAAEAARSAAYTAAQTLNKSIEQFRIDERAWVVLATITKTRTIPRDDKFPTTFVYAVYPKNVGKAIARDIIVKAENIVGSYALISDTHGVKMIQDELFVEQNSGKRVRIETSAVPKVLGPNVETPIPFIFAGSAPKTFETGGNWISCFVGRIDYIDAFGVAHWEKFCMFVANESGDLRYCRVGNDEDRNPEKPPPKEP